MTIIHINTVVEMSIFLYILYLTHPQDNDIMIITGLI